MIGFREIQAIARQMRRSGLDSIEIKGENYALRLRYPPGDRQPAAAAAPDVPPGAPAAVPELTIAAPLPGRVWLREPLGGQPLRADERTVAPGELVALLQVGALCLPLRAGQAATLDGFAVTQGQAVEFDQPIARLHIQEDDHEKHRS